MNKKQIKDHIKRWLLKEHGIRHVSSIRHIHYGAYVVGYASTSCLVIATPWMSAEPQIQHHVKLNPLDTVNIFDKSLRAGDWCISAYVCMSGGGQQTVAISIPYVKPKNTLPH